MQSENAKENETENLTENAIEVRDLKKKFKVFYDKGTSLKERILFRKRNRYEERWVLNGISFDVKKGEAIGLVGHNGCGKSTTLKLLTRIIYPDEGSIKIKGRVSSMIELGAGFHPDMSGRENIYIYASIFGLTKKEIDERMDDIIEFSELEEFLDNPVRTYSSGMYTRLAFSVAINVKADVLLIDEILAVGDANFQAKCFNKLREIKASGTTIVIVSHALSQIEQICERSIWIQDGRIKAEGTPREVHPQYMAFMGQKRDEINEKAAARKAEKEKKNAENAKNEKKDEK
ncbi:MAG: ABC transporter ATP-binding protein, partial [Firmicutes bacterium]|nr:ABC transporter ATP-binding protein [Bacillota bacterium]